MEAIGGMEHLKDWLQKRYLAYDYKAQQWHLTEPKGLLLLGVPGCGKSLAAKCISSQWRMPLLRLDIGKVFQGIVGSSEENIRRAIMTAETIAPCVLWIDEIEKGLAGFTNSGSDGGVSARLVGQFLFWLQECKKQVFVVATANDVSQLPAELLRRGRFDEIFFIDLPNDNERKSIISLYYRNYVGSEIDKTLLDKLVEASEGFTGAD